MDIKMKIKTIINLYIINALIRIQKVQSSFTGDEFYTNSY